MNETLGKNMLELMLHAIGGSYKKWRKASRQDADRNYFCACVDGPDANMWETLVGLGLAKRGRKINEDTMIYYGVSTAGLAAIKELERSNAK